MPASLDLALQLLEADAEVEPLQLWVLAPCAPIDHPRVLSLVDDPSAVGTIARWLSSPR